MLVAYVDPRSGPKGVTDRKDVVQAFALIAAGVVGLIGGIVGIANWDTSRRNLQQQRDLEEQRAQEGALQAYFEQIGGLLTDQDLINTDREDVRQLAQAQSHTVLARLDGPRKGALLRFLHVAELIRTDNPMEDFLRVARLKRTDKPIVKLDGADLSGADLSGAVLGMAVLVWADLSEADLSGALCSRADLRATVLRGVNLSGARLSKADLSRANLSGANLSEASLNEANLSNVRGITDEKLEQQASSLKGATMPDGQLYEDWLKDRESRGEDYANEHQ